MTCLQAQATPYQPFPFFLFLPSRVLLFALSPTNRPRQYKRHYTKNYSPLDVMVWRILAAFNQVSSLHWCSDLLSTIRICPMSIIVYYTIIGTSPLADSLSCYPLIAVCLSSRTQQRESIKKEGVYHPTSLKTREDLPSYYKTPVMKHLQHPTVPLNP
jgi:hypothetical protein